MNAIKSIFTLTLPVLIGACSDNTVSTGKDLKALQSWEVRGRDTLNRMDFAGNKQGHWEIRKSINEKLEEGDYVDNKKEGLWRSFNADAQSKTPSFIKTTLL
jgi:hypothetical protein